MRASSSRASCDSALRQYVTALLHSYDRSQSFLETPAAVQKLFDKLGTRFGQRNGGKEWLNESEAQTLLADATPDVNLPMPEKRELVTRALKEWDSVETAVKKRLNERAEELTESHRRIRQAVRLKVRNLTVTPQFPPDLLGILVLQPVV